MGIAVAIEEVPTGAPVAFKLEEDGNIVEEGKGLFLSELGEGLAKILANDMIKVVPISALLVEKLA